jgi:hypothetical protein
MFGIRSGHARLDSYDYRLVNPNLIHIYVESVSDVTIADIVTDINSHYGKIYLEGRYYKFISSSVGQFMNDGKPSDVVILELNVEPLFREGGEYDRI